MLEGDVVLVALLVAIGSVAAGAALGAISSRVAGRAEGPIQLFALSAAAAVVLAHLLPEAFREVGPASLAVFAVAFVVPLAVDAVGKRLRTNGGGSESSLELGYGGLIVHKLGDGLALGAVTGPMLVLPHGEGVVVAIAAHTVPLTALVVVTFQRTRGTRHALLRAAGLGVAMVGGVLIASAVPRRWVEPIEPWIVAVVAGLVLHVVVHGWRPVRPRSALGWVASAVAVAAGLSLVFVGGS